MRDTPDVGDFHQLCTRIQLSCLVAQVETHAASGRATSRIVGSTRDMGSFIDSASRMN